MANPKIKRAEKNTLPTTERGEKWILNQIESKLSYPRGLFQKLIFFLNNLPKQPLSQALLAPCGADELLDFTTVDFGLLQNM